LPQTETHLAKEKSYDWMDSDDELGKRIGKKNINLRERTRE
jgi:hypothetical protein